MTKTFKQEVLQWALDQDSVQHLLEIAPDRWALDRAEALKVIKDLAGQGLIEFLESKLDSDGYDTVPNDIITLDYINGHAHTWLGNTNKTFAELNAINSVTDTH